MNNIKRPGFHEICKSIHNKSSAGVAIGFCLRGGAPLESYFSYREDWLSHYSKNNLVRNDPTIAFGLSTNGIKTWADIANLGFDTEVFKEARNFDINNGTVFSLRINGSKTIASITHHQNRLDIESIKEIKCFLAVATIIVDEMHPEDEITLGFLDREDIRMATEGIEEAEMAEIFGVSMRQIRYRRARILAQFDVKTVPQLVYEVCSRGII